MNALSPCSGGREARLAPGGAPGWVHRLSIGAMNARDGRRFRPGIDGAIRDRLPARLPARLPEGVMRPA